MSIVNYVQMSDVRMSLRLVRWSAPRWFRRAMLVATRLGDGWFWLVALAVLTRAAEPGDALRALVMAAGAANVALIVLKRCCQRRRPAELGLALGSPRFAPELLAFDRFSFPSGHSLNAFAAASTVALRLPLAAPAMLLVAVAIAASRLFLGRHFLSDVLVGAALGIAIGIAAATFALV